MHAGSFVWTLFFFCNRQFFFPQVSSQHPYAEQYIGRPHVITIDYNNTEELDATIREILRINVRMSLRFRCSTPKTHTNAAFSKWSHETQRRTVAVWDASPAGSTHSRCSASFIKLLIAAADIREKC